MSQTKTQLLDGRDSPLTFPSGNGTNGQYLQTNGSGGSSWATVATPEVPLSYPGTAIDISGNSQITFTGISANAKRITIQFYEIGVSAGGANGVRFRAGGSGGINSSAIYNYQVGFGTSVDSTAGADHIRISHPGFTDAQHRYYGLAIFEKVNNVDRWVYQSIIGSIGYVSNPPMSGCGSFDLPNTLERVQIYTSSSTYAIGNLNILVEG